MRQDGWLEDLGSQTGSKTLLFGWFMCGFNIVGRLGPFNEAGQAIRLRGRWVY